MTMKWRDFYVDYSKNRMDAKTLELLLELAEETQLKLAIEKQFQDDQDKLMSNLIAQTGAFSNGKSKEEVLSEFKNQDASEESIQQLTNLKVFEGNKPTNTLLIDELTPESLGKLIALYEHKIFVQGLLGMFTAMINLVLSSENNWQVKF